MDDELLTLKEAYIFLRVSQSTLYRLTKERAFSVIKRGGYVRYRKSDLIAFLDKYTIKGGS